MTATAKKMLSTAEIKANIKTIAKNAAEWNNLVQETAIAILYHTKEHSNCSLAQILVMAIPATEKRTQQRAQLISWFLAYSPIMVKNDLEWTGKLVKTGKVAERGWLITEAENNPWFMHGDRASEDKAPIDIGKLIEMYRGLAKRIDTAIEKKQVAESDLLAAHMFASFVRTNNLPDFKIEAYLEKERLEREANAKAMAQAEQSEQDNKPEMIEPVAKLEQEQPVTAQAANG